MLSKYLKAKTHNFVVSIVLPTCPALLWWPVRMASSWLFPHYSLKNPQDLYCSLLLLSCPSLRHLGCVSLCLEPVGGRNNWAGSFVLRNTLILQTRVHRHPVGLDIWFLVRPFVYFHISCVRTVSLCDKYHNLMSWLKLLLNIWWCSEFVACIVIWSICGYEGYMYRLSL